MINYCYKNNNAVDNRIFPNRYITVFSNPLARDIAYTYYIEYGNLT